MTRVLLILLVLSTSSIAAAQEFKLEIKPNNLANPTPEMQVITDVFLGYDVGAEDILEEESKAWLEKRTYPVMGQISLYESPWLENSFGRDLAFRDPGTVRIADTTWQRAFRGDLSKMDIRRKPAVDSFTMRWILFVDPSGETAKPEDKMTLTWDRNVIPAKVNHLMLSYANGKQLIDMKTANSVVIFGDSLRSNGGSQNMTVTLYYNMGIKAGLHEATADQIRLSAYPNPAISHSKILLELKQMEYVTIAMYDVQGREVMSQSFIADMGMNELEIDRERLGLSSGVYFVRAAIGSGEDQLVKTTSIRIQ